MTKGVASPAGHLKSQEFPWPCGHDECLQCWGCLAVGMELASCTFCNWLFSCLKYRFSFCPAVAFYCQCLINCLKVGELLLILEYLDRLLGSAWNSRFGWITSQCIGGADINGTHTQGFYHFN